MLTITNSRLCCCIASDFVRKTIFEIPSHRAARLTRLEALDGVRSKDECGKAPTAGAEREVRDLRRGAHRTGDAAGGRGAVRSGSLDRGACVSDREAGGAGGAGRLGAGPAGAVAGGGRAGGDSSGGGAAAGHRHRAGGGAAPAPGKSALGLTAGPVPPRVDASVKAGLCYTSPSPRDRTRSRMPSS